jgi:hypothetical protein
MGSRVAKEARSKLTIAYGFHRTSNDGTSIEIVPNVSVESEHLWLYQLR